MYFPANVGFRPMHAESPQGMPAGDTLVHSSEEPWLVLCLEQGQSGLLNGAAEGKVR